MAMYLSTLEAVSKLGDQDSWAVKGIQREEKDWSHPDAIAARSSPASKLGPRAVVKMTGLDVLLKNDKSRVDVRLCMSRTFASLLLACWCQCEPEYINTKANIMPDTLSLLGEKGLWENFVAESSGLGLSPSESPVARQCSPYEIVILLVPYFTIFQWVYAFQT